MSRRIAESEEGDEGDEGGNRVDTRGMDGWGRVGGMRVVRINLHLRTS